MQKRDQGNYVNVEEARTAVNEKQGCEVVGFIKVNRVKGKISFGPHRSHAFIGAVGNLHLPLDYSHKFVSFSFGDDRHLN